VAQEGDQDPWDATSANLDLFERMLRRVAAINVNEDRVRRVAREVSLSYFRSARAFLIAGGAKQETVGSIDREFQQLLRLASGHNAKTSYERALKSLRALRSNVDVELVMVLPAASGAVVVRNQTEDEILRTLSPLVPSAAASYQQAIHDLREPDRPSWRGTAVELRECLRQTLDHLAPDGPVIATKGYKQEAGRTGPTMRQKVEFILRSRGAKSGAISPAAETATVTESAVGALTRATYTLGSVAVHVGTTRRDVAQLKRYVETVLSDLLELQT
jgi:hypothetical protein